MKLLDEVRIHSAAKEDKNLQSTAMVALRMLNKMARRLRLTTSCLANFHDANRNEQTLIGDCRIVAVPCDDVLGLTIQFLNLDAPLLAAKLTTPPQPPT